MHSSPTTWSSETGSTVSPGDGIGIQHLLFAEPETHDIVRNNQIHGNAGNGIDVPNGQANQIIDNDASDNAVEGATQFRRSTTFRDGNRDAAFNPTCDANVWSGNIWGGGSISLTAPTRAAMPPGARAAAGARVAGSEPVTDPPVRRLLPTNARTLSPR